MRKLKVSIVGSGYIAKRKHIPAWQLLAHKAELSSICDANVELARKVAADLGIARAYGSVEEMIEKERPDVVDICTPPRSHADVAVSCLRGGAHILVEKPMAVDAAECDRMIGAAREAKREICVVHSDLFYPAFMDAHRLVKEGRIGEVRGMRIFLSTPTANMTADANHWANRLPGGVVGETGPHIVYMTLAFINPIVRVRAVGRKVFPEYSWSPFEDYRIELEGEKATCSTILVYTTNQWAAQFDVWGSRGMVHVDIESQVVSLYDRPDLEPRTVGMSAVKDVVQTISSVTKATTQVMTKQFRTTQEQVLASFCDAILSGGPSPVSAEDGREAVRVMDLITRQLQSTASE